MQPAVGLTTEHMLEINEAVLRGGFDIVKDDELSHDSPLSPVEDRYERIAALTRTLSEETGEPKRYIANIITNPLRAIELLSSAESAGAHGVLVSPALQGLGFIANVRSRTHLPIMAHNTGDDMLTRQSRLGVHPALLIKLYRLCGADIVMLPGAAATTWQDDTEIEQCLDACFAPIPGIVTALPVLAGGKSADGLAAYRKLVGSPDFMLIVATALNAHPEGLSEGAAAFRRAWEALQ
jgi:ribulose 1,5-bisphosphate carboxylase large subunit-like protein